MKSRLLFVCVGNAVRSQMAEGFARAYGWDCVAPASAGLTPATRVDPTAAKLMADIGIDIGEHFSKHYQAFSRMEFDLIVNISGHQLPGPAPKSPVMHWDVEDPVGESEERYREARDLLQKLTLGLVDEIRKGQPVRVAANLPAKPAQGPMLMDRKRRLRQST